MGKKFDRFAERHLLPFIPKWVHPNLISLGQVLFLVPVFYWYRTHPWPAAIVFSCGKISDLLDGPVARTRGLKSKLGGFLDASSDKIYILVPLFFACGDRVSPSIKWTVFWIEAALTVVRIVEYLLHTKTSANRWGKLKTWAQSFALAFVLTQNQRLLGLAPSVFWVAIVFAALSLAGHMNDLRLQRAAKT